MKIVAHNGAAVFGGAEKAVALLLAGLQQRGHDIIVYCRDDRQAEHFRNFGLTTRTFSIGGDPVLPNAARFARRLRAEQPDVVLLTTFKKIWLAGMAAWLARAPHVVARVGLSSDVARRWKYRYALRHWVHTVVANSVEMRALLAADLPELADHRVVAIPTGVPLTTTIQTRGSLRSRLRVPHGSFLIGTLARLAGQKRLDRLLGALTHLPQTHCVIAGDGPHADALQNHASSLGIAERVHFIGHQTDTAAVLQDLDVFVLTSEKEGLSNAMLEALAHGVPVVSTRVSGAREALAPFSDGAAPGLIVDHDAEAIARGVQHILAARETAVGMRAAALRRSSEQFGYERMLDAWESLLTRSRSTSS